MKSPRSDCTVRVEALINGLRLDRELQNKDTFFSPFCSFQQMMAQRAPRSLGGRAETLPCCISSGTKSPRSP